MGSILVTGASGYVGGRLVARLVAAGLQVRVLVRNPGKLAAAPWVDQVTIVTGDVGGDLDAAMIDVDVAMYLVHSIGQGGDWRERELADATNFAAAAARAEVGRIVYLGGLGRSDDDLSPHLLSRHDVGRALAASAVPTVELRAGMILGSGSASFEMLRYLVDTLPIMVTPRWVGTKGQPIGIADVLSYLERAVTHPEPISGVFEIGGPDVITYAELMTSYAAAAGLRRRRLIPVPVLTPGLSAHWVGLVTPVPATLATELVESLVNEVTLSDDRAERYFHVQPMSVREALDRALAQQQSGQVPSRFTDADAFALTPTDPSWAGGTLLRDERQRDLSSSPETAFAAVTRIGGANGWYGGSWLWRIRGWLDLIAGGPGLRRGRRDPNGLRVGEPLDFWRVEELSPGHLRLRAEMLLPGDAWLTFDVLATPTGCQIRQVAEFRPHGVRGRLYWLGVAPFHRLVFPGLLRGIERDARGLTDAGK